MSPSTPLAWTLLSGGVALWAIAPRLGATHAPSPLATLVAGGVTGLYCALITGALVP